MYIISKDTENAIIINKCHWEGGVMAFTLNDVGEIGSQDHAMVTKILDFINKHPKLKVVKSFSYHLYRFFRNLAETDEKLQFFWSKNREIHFFFNFFITKVSYFVSNPNDNFSEASFEVYYVSVSQKLAIL